MPPGYSPVRLGFLASVRASSSGDPERTTTLPISDGRDRGILLAELSRERRLDSSVATVAEFSPGESVVAQPTPERRRGRSVRIHPFCACNPSVRRCELWASCAVINGPLEAISVPLQCVDVPVSVDLLLQFVSCLTGGGQSTTGLSSSTRSVWWLPRREYSPPCCSARCSPSVSATSHSVN